jgi:hypothetical protein
MSTPDPAPDPAPAEPTPTAPIAAAQRLLAAELGKQFVTALTAAAALCLVQQLLALLPGLPGLPDHRRRVALLHAMLADLDGLSTVGTPPAG